MRSETSLRAAIDGNPEDDWSLILLISTLGHLDQVDKAQTLIEALEELRLRQKQAYEDLAEGIEVGVDTLLLGPFILSDTNFWPFRDPEDRGRLRDGLQFAGVPESVDTDVSPLEVRGALTVDAVEAKNLHDQGATFVDVRNLPLWNLGHVEDAHWLDLKTDFTEANLLKKASRNDPVVIYCEGAKCLRSSQACVLAVSWGFQHVYYFRDGFPS